MTIIKNKRDIRIIKKLPYRTAPALIPSDLRGKEYSCSVCGKVSQIDWLREHEYPKTPVASQIGKGFWTPASIDQICSCGEITQISIPIGNTECNIDLYGDEAERFFRPGEIRNTEGKSQLFLHHSCRDSAIF